MAFVVENLKAQVQANNDSRKIKTCRISFKKSYFWDKHNVCMGVYKQDHGEDGEKSTLYKLF